MTPNRIAVFFLALAVIWLPNSLPASPRGEYVESVITILRSHARLLQELATGDRFKYSDNLVRHATALRQTFGLLGPMEWHAAQSARLYKPEAGDASLTEDAFETMAQTSQRSLNDLVRAAHDSMEEHDPEGMLTAIEQMKNACNACHALLPTSAVPDVWGNLQRD
jgi:hypothetical protein